MLRSFKSWNSSRNGTGRRSSGPTRITAAGALAKDAYLRQRADIDGKLAAAKAEQEAQEQLLSELEHLAFQDKAQEDDVFTSFAGATELTAELAQTFIKEVLVSSPTEIEDRLEVPGCVWRPF